MSQIPVIPEVILLDFLPQPGALQGLIVQRLPGLAATPAPRRGNSRPERHPPRSVRADGFILLDFLPSLGALEGVIKGRAAPTPHPADRGGHY